MEIYEKYYGTYPEIETALKLGGKIRIYRSETNLRMIEVDSQITACNMSLQKALLRTNTVIGNHDSEQDHENPIYPTPGDVLDMHIFKGGEFYLFYALQKNIFVCISTITDDIKSQIKNICDCCCGSGDNIIVAMTNCFVSPEYRLRRFVGEVYY